jgi:tRNA(Ile)-lysidine synthase
VNEFLQQLEQSIARHKLIADRAGALVAVSGGVDSMVLLHALAELSTTHRWKLVVAHFNHQLRGNESNQDARFVQRAAKRLRLRCVIARGDVKKAASEQKISIEMAARQLRHEFLARTAMQLGMRHVFLAHHADDQVELCFVRLLRGAGPQGLSGMEWLAPSPAARKITLLRPLLGERRSTLEEYARANHISFRDDTSNRSIDILRNRIRHKLLPLLRRDYQPGIDGAVRRSMELLRDEADFVTLEAIGWLDRKNRGAFDSLHPALQRRVVQIGLLHHGVVPQFDHVESLRQQTGRWHALGETAICRRLADGEIEMRPIPKEHARPAAAYLTLNARGGRASHDSVVVKWRVFRGRKLPKPRANTEFFDADLVGDRIVLRHWRDGDRFQPIGMKQRVKLQDFFVNQKIPRERRHELLLATTTDSNEIFWIEGQRIGERFKVTPTTRHILEWRRQRR